MKSENLSDSKAWNETAGLPQMPDSITADETDTETAGATEPDSATATPDSVKNTAPSATDETAQPDTSATPTTAQTQPETADPSADETDGLDVTGRIKPIFTRRYNPQEERFSEAQFLTAYYVLAKYAPLNTSEQYTQNQVTQTIELLPEIKTLEDVNFADIKNNPDYAPAIQYAQSLNQKETSDIEQPELDIGQPENKEKKQGTALPKIYHRDDFNLLISKVSQFLPIYSKWADTDPDNPEIPLNVGEHRGIKNKLKYGHDSQLVIAKFYSDLEEEKKAKRPDKPYTYDFMLLEQALGNLYEQGFKRVKPEVIHRQKYGLPSDADVSEFAVIQINMAITALSTVKVHLDFKEQVYNKDNIPETEYNGDIIDVKFANGYWTINRLPAIYEYSKNIGQISTIPTYLLWQDEKHNNLQVKIKNYLLQRIELAYKLDSKEVLITYKDMFLKIEYDKGDSARNRANIGAILRRILNYFKAEKYIKKHEFTKTGKEVTGVNITLHSKMEKRFKDRPAKSLKTPTKTPAKSRKISKKKAKSLPDCV